MDSGSADMATDEICEIVLRLPAKSIVRWMLTSKSWYLFIKSSNFINTHLNHAKTKQHRVLIFKEDTFGIFIESDMTFIEQESVRIPFPEVGLSILGSCKGLVLVSLRLVLHSLVLLWNPSLEKFKVIDSVDKKTHGTVFALGFDEASNDYKVVRIIKTTKNYFPEDVVDVYSLATDSWHRVKENVDDRFVLPTIGYTSRMAIHINGFVHWIAYYAASNMEEPGYFVILAFDFENEVFKLIDLPVTYHIPVQDPDEFHLRWFHELLSLFGIAVLQLQVLDGKLAVFGIAVDLYARRTRTWVMINYPLVESWSERNGLFNNDGKVLWPLICTEKGNCVFKSVNEDDNDKVSLMYYNAREERVYDLGVVTSYLCPVILDFVECLVLLDVENPVLDLQKPEVTCECCRT